MLPSLSPVVLSHPSFARVIRISKPLPLTYSCVILAPPEECANSGMFVLPDSPDSRLSISTQNPWPTEYFQLSMATRGTIS